MISVIKIIQEMVALSREGVEVFCSWPKTLPDLDE